MQINRSVLQKNSFSYRICLENMNGKCHHTLLKKIFKILEPTFLKYTAVCSECRYWKFWTFQWNFPYHITEFLRYLLRVLLPWIIPSLFFFLSVPDSFRQCGEVIKNVHLKNTARFMVEARHAPGGHTVRKNLRKLNLLWIFGDGVE